MPKVKYVVIIGGAKFRSPAVAEKAYAAKIKCPSLHFIGIFSYFYNFWGQLFMRTRIARSSFLLLLKYCLSYERSVCNCGHVDPHPYLNSLMAMFDPKDLGKKHWP